MVEQRRKPVIGITSNFDLEKDGYFCFAHYVRAVEQAGGRPILLPYTDADDVEAVLDLCQGLLLTGGGDFPTDLYGAPPHPAVARMIPARDRFEFALTRAALQRPQPILGICRGMQILNVVEGGTIYPHTTDKVTQAMDHRDGTPLDQTVHEVRVEPGTRLREICGVDRFHANSFHHQAVDRLAPGYVISARAEDGIVEAIEAPSQAFRVGVQWHPEWMVDSEAACRRLFERFITACA